MINAPVGYKTKNLLAMRSVDERQLSAFVGELKGLSCVDRVGKTQGLLYSVVIIGLLLIRGKIYLFSNSLWIRSVTICWDWRFCVITI